MPKVGSGLEIVDTIGHLDLVDLDGKALRFWGWVASLEVAQIDGFRVHLPGGDTVVVRDGFALPSPDVRVVHPELHQSKSCRFRLVVPLSDDEHNALSASIVGLTPLFGEREGRMLIKVPTDTIPVPSQNLIDMIGGGFLEVSAEFLCHGIQLARLQPDHDVLDIGCGCGRMAYSLAHFLRPESRYEGFDIIGDLIDWAKQAITIHRPNFHFHKVDIYNKMYNPKGALRSSTFSFPYDDASFDYVLLTSVFTHMFLEDIDHYLDEIHRVLRPGGRSLFTCFLLNEESRALIRAGKSSRNFVYPVGTNGYTSDPNVPEGAIGFDEPFFLEHVKARGFDIAQVHHGSWCGRSQPTTSYQDIIVAEPRWDRSTPLSQGGREFRSRPPHSRGRVGWGARRIGRLLQNIVATKP